jgi:hypothetical protein
MRISKILLAFVSVILLVATASAATTITPSSAYTNDNLFCNVNAGGTYIYEWHLDGEYKVTGQTLDASYTEPDQTWDCIVFLPPTQWTLKFAVDKASITIISTNTPGNNVPTVPTVTLSAGPYLANSIITATASSTDADGDPVTYQYNFTRGGSQLSSSNTLSCAGTCAKGNTISVSARAYDTKDYSAWSTATTLTISNAPPATPTITLNPTVLYTNSTVTVTAASSDLVDGDAITYQYAFYNVNDSLMVQGYSAVNTYTFNSSFENKTMRFYATASDGTATVTNSVDVVILSPTANIVKTYAYCSANSSTLPIRIYEIKNLDSIENEEFYPLDEFKVKVQVENQGDKSKTVYVKAIIVKNNLAVSDTEVDKKVKVSDGDTETLELNMTIPVDLREGDYSLYVKVYDENNKTNCEQRIIPFKVIQNDRDILLREILYDPSNALTCNSVLTFSGKLANIGLLDEERVKITYEDDLKNKFTDEIDNLDSGEESRTFTFYANIPKNATEGKKKITLTLNYDYDEDDDSYGEKATFNTLYSYTVSGCKVANVTTTAIMTPQNITNQTAVTSPFSDFVNNNWKLALIIVEGLIVIFVIVKILLMKA